MRIAQIAPPWFSVPPAGYGGIEWVVALLADGLAANGHDVTLYASGGSTTKATLKSYFETPPGAAHLGETWWDAMHAAFAYLDADAFDVIHDHSGMVGPSIGVHVRPPVVHTLHGPFVERSEAFYRLLSGRIHYVAISEAQREFCPDLSYAGTVHNGIDLSLFPYRETKEDFLLFLGRVNREKGPELAVEVAKRTGKRLVMAIKKAEAFEDEYWRTVVEPALTGDEEIIGEITAAEKADLLARASCVLFPIQWPEPFGLVMAEANACGTPVLAFPYGAAPEVIADGETGYLCSSIDEMCHRVADVARIDPAACRQHVERNFSAAKMVEGYERIFERLGASR